MNKVWISLFLISALSSIYQSLILGNIDVFRLIVLNMFSMTKMSVDIMLILFGTITLWLGLLKIAENSGLVNKISNFIYPLFEKIMPEIPKNHPVFGTITMSLSANILGLDNASIPIGLRAMKELQNINPYPEEASNAQIMLLVLSASSLTIIPINIFMFRAQQGSINPTLVFLPIIISTSISTLAGFFTVAFYQKIKIYDPIILKTIILFSLFIGILIAILLNLSAVSISILSSLLGNLTLFILIISFILYGTYKKINVYDAFIDGAKDGFDVSKNILPYLIAMLCAVGALRSSGALDYILYIIKYIFNILHCDSRFVDALPTAIMKPFSGSAARSTMLETMSHFGVDSFPALLSAVMQGSSETTFYFLTVYFGSIGIKNYRHALVGALASDIVGMTTAILVCYWFFG
ncbi:Spore maturation protein B [Candidatus Kinetoplastibacterium sorsogonicusi]|uniref:Spore maturation protein B n=1 Tax=Candidatus Kinetoplastidibacterium kentomonadis TaxID=1576550 RepID=A0A3Q8EX74_9PROT|nr:spore maturation protein [Candidatus Kinetoplastibacterium sorsogonicusi]AWD32652.1 Spore maturation protein B [Candidatus Kinetoplastibacterium sorsogonicusi]